MWAEQDRTGTWCVTSAGGTVGTGAQVFLLFSSQWESSVWAGCPEHLLLCCEGPQDEI